MCTQNKPHEPFRSFTDRLSVFSGIAVFQTWRMITGLMAQSDCPDGRWVRKALWLQWLRGAGAQARNAPKSMKMKIAVRKDSESREPARRAIEILATDRNLRVKSEGVAESIMDRQDIRLSTALGQQAPALPAWKRMLDLALIVAVSPGLLLLAAGVTLLVVCGSRGPVLFRQRRVGYKGRQFTCYKFRTMVVDANSESHRDHLRQLMGTEVPMTKLDARSDPRLAPFGAALRATGLDELPQLINVIRGEMSIVGPRPCIPYEYELYEPWHRRRFDAVPGLTGLWQVSGKNRTTFNEMIRLDIEYAERSSLWFDLRIILKTLPALWGQCLDIRAARRKQAAPTGGGIAKSVELYRL
jgi:lipopolysaccharide/colanic/teichoic acid biosynthesis glycosyltransferase